MRQSYPSDKDVTNRLKPKEHIPFNERPGWILMSEVVCKNFTPHDLQLSDKELVYKYWFHCYGYYQIIKFHHLIPIALRKNITVNLCGHLCN